jgi:hypothetical protein
MDKDRELPPRPGEEKVKKQIQPPVDAIPLYLQGMNFPLTEGEALGVISQLASALQTRSAGLGVVRNG